MPDQNTTAGDTAPERPAEPFKPLGNETRIEILRVLYDQRQSTSRDATLSYSTLREEVGVRDKGNFNYHLRQLDGLFVERGDGTGTDGYRLTFAGFEIAKVIDVDAWQSHEPCGPVVLDDPGDGDDDGTEAAPRHPLTATYEDSVVEIRRGDELLYAHAVRPTGAAARGMAVDALLDVASTLWRHTVEQLLENICPYCHAPVERTLEYAPDRRWAHTFGAHCDECGSLGGSHVGAVALAHPAAIAFCWEHGRDLTSARPWDLPFVDDDAVTVVSEEPRRLRIDVEFAAERLELIVDDDVRVVETERVVRDEP